MKTAKIRSITARRALRFSAAAMLLASAAQAWAGDVYWDGDGTGNQAGGPGSWDTTLLRWSATAGGTTYNAWVNANNDTAIFSGGTASAPGGALVTLTAPISARNLIFSTRNFTLSSSAGANTLTLVAAGTGSGTAASIEVTNGTDTATINSIIAGAAGLRKNGSGTLILNGINTYTGGTNVDAGVLRVTNASAMAAGAVAVNSGGVLEIGGVAVTANDLTLNNGATLRGTGAASYTKSNFPVVTAAAAVTMSTATPTDVLTIGSAVRTGGGGAAITINGPGRVAITSGSSAGFSGAWNLSDGILSLSNADALGAPASVLNLNGGFLANSSTTLTAYAINMAGGTLGALSTAPTYNSVITLSNSVTNNIAVYDASAIATGRTITNTNTVSGSATSDIAIHSVTTSSAGAGTFLLSSNTTTATTGAIPTANSITLQTNSTLALTNGIANSTNRVGDAIPIRMNNGRIFYTSGTGVNTETFGNITENGFSLIGVSPTGTSTALTFGTVTRENNGTMYIRGPIGGALSATTAQVSFSGGLTGISDPSGPVGGQNMAVIPWIGASRSATSTFARTFATYDANGVRILDNASATDFAQIAAAAPLTQFVNNAVNGSPAALTANIRVNSLAVQSTSTFTGAFTLTVNSGAIANFLGFTFSGPTLDFGANTGYFHLGDNGTFTSGGITGSAGVVVSSFSSQTLDVRGITNGFSGGLTVNGNASILFSADSNLGTAGGALTLGGGALSFGAVATSVTSSRSLTVGPAGGTVNVTDAGSTFGLSSGITGSGPLFKTGSGSAAFTGSNTGFTGNVVVSAGTLVVGSDANLGGGGTVILNGGTLLTSGGGITTSKNFVQNGTAGGINTNGLNSTINGVVSNTTTASTVFTKGGAGNLTLTAANTLSSGVTVAGGGLILSGANGSARNVSAFTVSGGSKFTLDNVSANNGDRLLDRASMSVGTSTTTGEFAVLGNSSATSETLGALTVTGLNNIVTLDAASGGNIIIDFSGFTLNASSSILFRGTNLGGNSGTFTRIRFVTPIANNLSGYISGLTFDNSATGTGIGSVSYNSASDAFGVIGLSLFTAPTATGNRINNGSPENVPTNAVFTTAGNTTFVGNAATIDALVVANTTSTVTLDGATATGSLNLAGGGLTINSGNAGVTFSGGSPTASVNFGSAGVITANSPASFNLVLAGSSGVTINGTGPVNFNVANTITGPLAVNAGAQLNLNNAVVNTFTALTGSGNIAIGSGANLTLTPGASATIAATLSGPGSVTWAPTAIAQGTFSGVNSYQGGTNVGPNGGLLLTNFSSLGTGSVTFTNTASLSNMLVFFGTGNGTWPNGLNLSTTNAVSSQISTFPGAQVVTLSGKVSGGGPLGTGTLSINGTASAGSEIILSNAANDFRNTIDIFEGFLGFTSDAALGNAANGFSFQPTNPGGIKFEADNISLAATRGFLMNSSTFFGSLDTKTNTGTIQGVMSGTAGYAKLGTGTLVVTNSTNSYAGSTSINFGRVIVTANNALGTTAGITNVASGAGLGFTGGVSYTTAEPVTVTGTGADGAGGTGAIHAYSGANVFSGPITLAGTSEIGAEPGASLELRGAMTGANGVTKVGGGVLNYTTAAKTYTGATTINAGTLLINVAHNGTGTGAGAIAVNSGGSLGGTGPITLASAANLTLAGNVSPGNSPGTLVVNTSGGGVTDFQNGGSYSWEINSQTGPAGTTWDLLDLDAVTVTATGGGFTIRVISLTALNQPGPVAGWDPAGTPGTPQRYTIATSSNNSFLGVNLTAFTVDTSGFQNVYPEGWSVEVGNSGGSLDLVYVPEPSSAFVGMAIAGGAMLRRRRRSA